MKVNNFTEANIYNELAKKVKKTLKPLVGKLVPGFLVSIAKEGHVIYSDAMGYRSVEAQEPMKMDTIIRLASMTKPIIGVATMILLERGHFSLDDDIEKYLPEFGELEVYKKLDDGSLDVTKAKPITIKHLLTHTSGLSYYIHLDPKQDPVAEMYRSAGLISEQARTKNITNEQYVKKISELPLMAQPGDQWHYGESMAVLGRLVEVISGQSLGQFLSQHIFEPLGMVDTGFYVPTEKLNRLAVLYTCSSEDGKLAVSASQFGDFSQQSAFESGSSGLVGTGADYLRFSQMLANKGELEGVRLMESSTASLMMSNHVNPELAETAFIGEHSVLGKCLGFGFTGTVVTDTSELNPLGSKGEFSWGGGCGTYFWVDHKENLTGMLLSQFAPVENLLPIQKTLHDLIYQELRKL